MKINNNISALVTNRQLLRNEDYLAASMEKLASGLKINHAADNPSGMAISGKMRAQINGLDRASQNASDGVSVLQTADGALNEVTSMIQRMRELSVQAANGIVEQQDKEAIQSEISSLLEEVDRIATSTEFNTKTLLDGSLDTRVYA
ncbi:MAG: flagellin, partial [Lachnospiraceae bacterium]|nr:flagellin [Lachnospiraceae bacterium]